VKGVVFPGHPIIFFFFKFNKLDKITHKLSLRFTWTAYKNKGTPTAVTLETAINVYNESPVVTFDIIYIKGLTNSSDPKSKKGALSTFPSFVMEDSKVELGWMTWAGTSEFYITIMGVVYEYFDIIG